MTIHKYLGVENIRRKDDKYRQKHDCILLSRGGGIGK